MTRPLINPPYHPALSLYCSETEWAPLSALDRTHCLREWGIRDMNVLIQVILWPTDNKRYLYLKPFHLDMIRLFEACLRGKIPHKELLYLIPRFHLKTQLITTAGAVWVLLNDPDESILVNSQHLDLATRITDTIRSQFRFNTLFRQCYPEWCPPENLVRGWESQAQMTVCNRKATRKEPSVMAGSFEAPKTGDHFGVLLNDDPHNEKNISTIDQIEKVKDGWKAQGPLGDGERTRRIYVATRWHFADINDLIMQKRAPLFYKKFTEKTLIHNVPLANIEEGDKCAVFLLDVWANEEKSEVIWPEKEPVENIKDYRDQWGSYFFSCQMENDPVPPEDRTFNPENFRYYETVTEIGKSGKPERFHVCGETKIGEADNGQPILRYRKIPEAEVSNILTIDPAFGIKPHNDYVGMVVCGHWIDPESRRRWLIVRETVREKMTPMQFQRRVEELCQRWDIKRVGIEVHGLQQHTEQVKGVQSWAGQMNIEIIPINRGSENFVGKARVTRLEPYYETRRIWHHPSMRNGVLEQELLGFVGGMSRGASDDLADAMSDQVDFPNMRKMPDFDPKRGAKSMDNAGPWFDWNPKDRDEWRRI